MSHLAEWAAGQHPQPTAAQCRCIPNYAKDGSITHAAECPVPNEPASPAGVPKVCPDCGHDFHSAGNCHALEAGRCPCERNMAIDIPAIDWQQRALDAERQLHDMLLRRGHGIASEISNNQLLEEILGELRKANSVERTGAVSSVEVKFLAPTKDNPLGRAQPVVKLYAGSEAPVDEAIIAYAKTVVLAERGQMEGWAATVERLPQDLQGSGGASSGGGAL